MSVFFYYLPNISIAMGNHIKKLNETLKVCRLFIIISLYVIQFVPKVVVQAVAADGVPHFNQNSCRFMSLLIIQLYTVKSVSLFIIFFKLPCDCTDSSGL